MASIALPEGALEPGTFKPSLAPSNLAFRHVDDVPFEKRGGVGRYYCVRSDEWWGTNQWLLRLADGKPECDFTTKIPAALAKLPAMTHVSASQLAAIGDSFTVDVKNNGSPVVLSHYTFENSLGPIRRLLHEDDRPFTFTSKYVETVELGINAHVAAFLERYTPAACWWGGHHGRLTRCLGGPKSPGRVVAVAMCRKLKQI